MTKRKTIRIVKYPLKNNLQQLQTDNEFTYDVVNNNHTDKSKDL